MIRFRVRRGVTYVSFSERVNSETIGVYMKNNDYRHFQWAGVMDRRIGKYVNARLVKIIMDEYTTDSDPLRATWHKIRDDSVLLGYALPSTYMQWAIFAVIEDDQPVILKMPAHGKTRR